MRSKLKLILSLLGIWEEPGPSNLVRFEKWRHRNREGFPMKETYRGFRGVPEWRRQTYPDPVHFTGTDIVHDAGTYAIHVAGRRQLRERERAWERGG